MHEQLVKLRLPAPLIARLNVACRALSTSRRAVVIAAITRQVEHMERALALPSCPACASIDVSPLPHERMTCHSCGVGWVVDALGTPFVTKSML